MQFRAPARRQGQMGLEKIKSQEFAFKGWRQPTGRLQGQAAIAGQGHLLMSPAIAAPDHAFHSEGIEDFVRQHHAAAGFSGEGGPIEPANRQRGCREAMALPFDHAWIGFHQHQAEPFRQCRPAGMERFSELQGQLALARSGFNQGQGAFTEPRQPLHQLGSEQLGQWVAQAGRGGEITAGAHPQAPGAIGTVLGIMESPVHVLAEGHRPASTSQPLRQPGGSLRGGIRRLGGRQRDGVHALRGWQR